MIVEGQLKSQPKPGFVWNSGLMRSAGGKGARGKDGKFRARGGQRQSALLRYAVLRETKCSPIRVEIRETLVAGVENAVYRFNLFQIKACIREMVTAATDF